MSIVVNLEKAKDISHQIRREARSKEFEPYDQIIAKQIPGVNASFAEQQRQIIRDKYAEIQAQIDEALQVENLKSIVDSLKDKT